MRFVKKILYISILLTCVLLTGCNSIIFNGNLKFEAYDPPPLMKTEITGTQPDEVQQGKYDIEGTDAFYIPETYMSDPDQIENFKFIDYNEEQQMVVYAFTAPLQNQSGKATVLMTYQPETKAYHVWFSQVNQEETPLLFAGIMQTQGTEKMYYIFTGGTLYVFGNDGSARMELDLGALLAQQASAEEEVSILEIMVDSNYNFFISTITESKQIDQGNLEELEEEDLETAKRELWMITSFPLGGQNPELVFVTELQNTDNILAKWKEHEDTVFASEEEMLKAQESSSLDGIREQMPEQFSDFYLKVVQNGALQSFPNYSVRLLGSEITEREDSLRINIFWSQRPMLLSLIARSSVAAQNQAAYEAIVERFLALLQENAWKENYPFWWWYWLAGRIQDPQGKSFVRPDTYHAGTGDQNSSKINTINFFSEDTLSDYRKVLWGNEKKAWPYYVLIGEIEATGQQSSTIVPYMDIKMNNRFTTGEQPVLKPVKSEAEATVSRTWKYLIAEETTKVIETEEGEETVSETTYTEETVEESDLLFDQYYLEFPENTYMYCMQKISDSQDMVASGMDGVAYYHTNDSTSGDVTTSTISYKSGNTVLLKDENVPGEAMSAEIKYIDHENPVFVFITTEGIALYPNAGGMYPTDRRIFLEYSQLGAEQSYEIESDSILMQGEARENLTPEKLFLLSETELGILSENKGIRIYDTEKKASVSLHEGNYYAASLLKNGSYAVIGFETEEYSYEPKDIVRAKFYNFDLNEEKQEKEAEFYQNYLENCLQLAVEQRASLTTEEEKEAAKHVKQIFYADTGWESALQELMQQMDQNMPDQELVQRVTQWVEEKRSLLAKQKQAFLSFYSLTGVSRAAATVTEENGKQVDDLQQILDMEDRLMDVYYTEQLEVEMVEYALLRSRVEALSGNQELYQEYLAYRRAYLAYQQEVVQQGSVSASINQDNGSDYIVIERPEPDAQADWSQYREELSKKDFYQRVLDDIKARYEKTAEGMSGVTWEEYLSQMLYDLTLGAHKPLWQQAVERFWELGVRQVGETEAMAKKELQSCKNCLDLEEKLIERMLKTSVYQNQTELQTAWNSYQDQKTGDAAKDRSILKKSLCYQIITEIQEQQELSEDSSWDELLNQIMKDSGALLTDPENTASDETKQSAEADKEALEQAKKQGVASK